METSIALPESFYWAEGLLEPSEPKRDNFISTILPDEIQIGEACSLIIFLPVAKREGLFEVKLTARPSGAESSFVDWATIDFTDPKSCGQSSIWVNCNFQSASKEVQRFDEGPIEYIATGLQEHGGQIFKVGGYLSLSRNWLIAKRLNASCVAANFCLTLLSILCLISVLRRRRELFSICSLLSLALVSAFNGGVSTFALSARERSFKYNMCKYINKESLLSVDVLIFGTIGTLLYAWVHNIFSLQYLRAAITLPLHFERRRRKDSNFKSHLPELDRKIRQRTWAIIAVQTISTLACFSYVISTIPREYELN
mmetsp:Transcript_11514/g.14492  ORF Transcript_11514/g.14492 Transcript_11514/m.14492 type:complete len:312 (-) Transcript_11514:758-1693(-)